MTPEQQKDAHCLWQSVQNVLRMEPQLNALMDYLSEEVQSMNWDDGSACWNNKVESYYGRKTLITATVIAHADIFRRGSGQKGPSDNQFGSLSFQLVLGNPELIDESADWPWRKQPSLIAGWNKYHDADGWEKGNYWLYDNFDPIGDAVNHPVKCLKQRSEDGRVWGWHEDGKWAQGKGFFALPVFALEDEADLKSHVVEPLNALFEGKTAEEAFPHDSPVFRFG